MKELTDPNNPLARALAIIEKDEEERFGATQMKSVTTRLPLEDVCKIDALASVAGGSRAQILENLLLSGLEQVLQNLKQQTFLKYADALEAEYDKAFPSSALKVEVLGADDESVTKADLEVSKFHENRQILKGAK